MTHRNRNWHEQHRDESGLGARLADKVASFMGSWRFIIIQSVFVVLWMGFNCAGWFLWHWDAYPFILLNLLFSTQAAYAAPIIMMSQNRASERDRIQAQHDYDTNVAANEGVQLLLAVSKKQTEELTAIRQLLKGRDE